MSTMKKKSEVPIPFHSDYRVEMNQEEWCDFDDSPPHIRVLMNEYGYDCILDAMFGGCFDIEAINHYLESINAPKPLRPLPF